MRAEKKMIVMPALIMITLSMTGVAFAHWSDEIYFEGTIKTGSLALAFDWYELPVCIEFHEESPGGPLLLGEIYGENVGHTICSCQDVVMGTKGQGYETIVVEIQNAYPFYRVHCVFVIHNIGAIPADICEFIVTDPTGVLMWNPDLSALVDYEGNPIIYIEHTGPVGGQIDPCNTEKAELDFLIAQDAEEGRTYYFEIAIAYTQWEQTMENSQVPPVTIINIVVDNDWENDEQVEADVGGNFTWGVNAFAKIQDAIDNASPNDNIFVYPGIYKENVTVDVENLTLIGVGGPVLDASGYDFGFSVQAAGVTIDNFAVMNASSKGIGVRGENIEGGSVTIRNNSISNNKWGIYFCSSIVNSEVGITGNTIDNNGRDGICFYDIVNSEVGITGNTAGNNGCEGILVVGGIENSVVGITGNTIDNNGLRGIYFNSIVNSEVGITGNTVNNNDYQGICFYASIVNGVVEIAGNTVDNNGHEGILFQGGIENSVVEVTGNTVDSNKDSGIYIKGGVDAMRIKVKYNNIVNNTPLGVNNLGPGILNAENNWWGTPVESEILKMIYGLVDYDPWLDAPH